MRVFYLGYAYLAVSGALVVDPEMFPAASDIPLPFFGKKVFSLVEDAVFSLTEWTKKVFKEKGCINYGGIDVTDSYIPRNKGGLEVFFTMPADWRLTIKLKGTILGQEIEDESKGGKVSLFEAETVDKSITFGLQRMYNGYRGKGIFRFIARWGSNGALNLITTEGLSGYYSMKDWSALGTHILVLECVNGALRFKVNNSYLSRPVNFPWAITANKSIRCMIGNRLNRLSNQHAQTEFTEFTLEKI
jgi:TM2 domain-containing membrane protein YozV